MPIFRSSAKSRIVMSGKRMRKPIQNQPEAKRLCTRLRGLACICIARTMLTKSHPFKKVKSAMMT